MNPKCMRMVKSLINVKLLKHCECRIYSYKFPKYSCNGSGNVFLPRFLGKFGCVEVAALLLIDNEVPRHEQVFVLCTLLSFFATVYHINHYKIIRIF